jgi:hypothetical protein
MLTSVLDMALISIWEGVDHFLNGGGTAGDLDEVLLSSTCEATILERAAKMGDMVTVEGPITTARPGGVEHMDG